LSLDGPVLGVETSCDETGVALFDPRRGVLGERLHSQVALHAEYGGVVPELASRDHVRYLAPLIRSLLAECGVERPAGVAYTAGPGLAGALLVGASVASALAWAWEVPVVAVHHMEGHLLAPLLADDAPHFPFLALLVSGGHTQLVAVEGLGRYRILGETLDDAVGEAFDKVAKMLGLGYPGGPEVARLAEQGCPGRFRFPRPMVDRPGLDFSFSGLKTAVLNAVEVHGEDPRARADIAHAFQEAVVETLLVKCRRAVAATGMERLVVAGGVGANRRLREVLLAWGRQDGVGVFFPPPALCTDNGTMIAHVGALRLAAGERSGWAFTVRPRWPLSELAPPGGLAGC